MKNPNDLNTSSVGRNVLPFFLLVSLLSTGGYVFALGCEEVAVDVKDYENCPDYCYSIAWEYNDKCVKAGCNSGGMPDEECQNWGDAVDMTKKKYNRKCISNTNECQFSSPTDCHESGADETTSIHEKRTETGQCQET